MTALGKDMLRGHCRPEMDELWQGGDLVARSWRERQSPPMS